MNSEWTNVLGRDSRLFDDVVVCIPERNEELPRLECLHVTNNYVMVYAS
jgi:hypothetical protein